MIQFLHPNLPWLLLLLPFFALWRGRKGTMDAGQLDRVILPTKGTAALLSPFSDAKTVYEFPAGQAVRWRKPTGNSVLSGRGRRRGLGCRGASGPHCSKPHVGLASITAADSWPFTRRPRKLHLEICAALRRTIHFCPAAVRLYDGLDQTQAQAMLGPALSPR